MLTDIKDINMKIYKVYPLFSLLLLCNVFIVKNISAQNLFQEFPASEESPAGMLTIESEDDSSSPSFTPGLVYAKYGDRELRINLITPYTPVSFPGADVGKDCSDIF